MLNSISLFQIREITSINHLHELRTLNLSSNQIYQMNGLRGLKSLVELNLNKNNITEVVSVQN